MILNGIKVVDRKYEQEAYDEAYNEAYERERNNVKIDVAKKTQRKIQQ